MQGVTGNSDITFEGFLTDDETKPISKTPTIIFNADNRVKADPTLSPYKQCGYLETYFFDGISIYTKQGTGALIDGDRFVTAGSMLYSQDHFTGWASSSLIWIASQDGRGTLTNNPTSGQNGGHRFSTMSGWVNRADSRYDMGYITMNSSLEEISGRLNYSVPREGAVLSNIVSYTGNLFEQTMWGNETLVINTPELLFHDITISEGSIGAPIIQNSSLVGVTTTLEKQGSMNQALAIRQELYGFFSSISSKIN
ncbi:hypothetical protein MKX69_09160 [Enterococcus sp. FSL R5-0957]|uniref:trypsin-like serine peptidase n=1 Tax=Enterococcus sp. FSL R5-0957 TaxID=2921725 RepID=UPI0030F52CA0